MASVEVLAAVTLVQDRCHRVVVLHTVLYTVLCPNAASHQRYGKGRIMDYPLWVSQDLPIRRLDNPGRRRLQTPQKQVQAQPPLTMHLVFLIVSCNVKIQGHPLACVGDYSMRVILAPMVLRRSSILVSARCGRCDSRRRHSWQLSAWQCRRGCRVTPCGWLAV